MRLDDFVKESLTYEGYCYQLDLLKMGICESALVSTLGHDVVTAVDKISDDINEPKEKLIDALKHKDVFKLLTATGYGIKQLLKVIIEGIRLIKTGIIDLFVELHKSGYIDFLRSGAIDLDVLLNKYPALKKITGPAVGAILLVMWLNMAFIGDPDEDFDVDYIVSAVKGKYSLYDLFVSPEGMFQFVLLAASSSINFSWWLAREAEWLIAALIYTGAKKTPSLRAKLKKILPVKG